MLFPQSRQRIGELRAGNSGSDKAWSTLAGWKKGSALITNHRKENIADVKVGRHTIISKLTINYLDVMIDTKLVFRKHRQYPC